MAFKLLRKYLSNGLSMISSKNAQMRYPSARRDPTVIDTYHGVKVADPYRWLEDPDSEETKKFVSDQQDTFNSYLKEHEDVREKVNQRLTELYNFERFACPTAINGRYILIKNTGLQNQDVCFLSESLSDLQGSELLDPNKLSSDGTVALTGMGISHDGKLMAYSLSEAGSDWRTVRFKKLEEKFEELPDVLLHVKFSTFQWTADDTGGFYNVYDAGEDADGTEIDKNEFCKTFYHRLGSKQEEDILVLDFPSSPGLVNSIEATDDNRYLVATIRRGCKNENCIWVYDMEKHGRKITENMQWEKIIDEDTFCFRYIMNSGSKFYFLTNCDGADRYKVIALDIDHPDKRETIVPEDPQDIIEDCYSCGRQKYLLINKIHDVKSVLQIYQVDPLSLVRTIDVGMATVATITARRTGHEIFYCTTSFLSPSTIYRIDTDLPNLKSELYYETKFPTKVNLESLTTEQVFYTSSKDPKVRIPMYIIHKKGFALDGTNPTILYGYGGFGINLMPSFSVARLLWVHDFDGVVAIPNIRGGGEYGEEWHRQGQLLNKKNCFYDFCDAAEYLIKKKYTSQNRLVIHGGSNGGLLVAACANLRKDLFRLAVPEVGVMDMLRFQNWTIGNAWISDYGCSTNELDFQNLYSYSPLHNIPEEGPFPAVLCMTADHDDRVVPAHTLKYMAELQYKLGNRPEQKHPLVAFIESKAGHGQGKPISKRIASFSIMLTVASAELEAKMVKY